MVEFERARSPEFARDCLERNRQILDVVEVVVEVQLIRAHALRNRVVDFRNVGNFIERRDFERRFFKTREASRNDVVFPYAPRLPVDDKLNRRAAEYGLPADFPLEIEIEPDVRFYGIQPDRNFNVFAPERHWRVFETNRHIRRNPRQPNLRHIVASQRFFGEKFRETLLEQRRRFGLAHAVVDPDFGGADRISFRETVHMKPVNFEKFLFQENSRAIGRILKFFEKIKKSLHRDIKTCFNTNFN